MNNQSTQKQFEKYNPDALSRDAKKFLAAKEEFAKTIDKKIDKDASLEERIAARDNHEKAKTNWRNAFLDLFVELNNQGLITE